MPKNNAKSSTHNQKIGHLIYKQVCEKHSLQLYNCLFILHTLLIFIVWIIFPFICQKECFLFINWNMTVDFI